MNKNFILKLIAVIIMQALLLTQVEFCLAATNQNEELGQNREFAYKLKYNIAGLSTNLLASQSYITGLIFNMLDFKNMLSFLSGIQIEKCSLNLSSRICEVSKNFYKVFVNFDNPIAIKNRFISYTLTNEYLDRKVAETEPVDATGPPLREPTDVARVDNITELLV